MEKTFQKLLKPEKENILFFWVGGPKISMCSLFPVNNLFCHHTFTLHQNTLLHECKASEEAIIKHTTRWWSCVWLFKSYDEQIQLFSDRHMNMFILSFPKFSRIPCKTIKTSDDLKKETWKILIHTLPLHELWGFHSKISQKFINLGTTSTTSILLKSLCYIKIGRQHLELWWTRWHLSVLCFWLLDRSLIPNISTIINSNCTKVSHRVTYPFIHPFSWKSLDTEA